MQILLWLLAAFTTLAAGYLTYRSDRRRAVPYPWLTAGLRSLVLLLVWFLLLAPTLSVTRQETEQPVVVVLQDESQSIPAALKGDTTAYRQALGQLVNRLSGKYKVVEWGFGGRVQNDSLFRYLQSATDIAAALDRVYEFYGQQNLGAVVMATDGRFNQGTHPLFQELALKSPLYTVSLGDTVVPKDLRLAQVYANRTTTLNSQFEIRADIIATRCNGYNGSAQLTENGSVLQTVPLNIAGDRFDRSVSFTVKATTAGLHHYVLVLPVADGERNTVNNRHDVFVEVLEEKKTVLIAAAAPHPDINALREALEGLDAYKVVVRIGNELPASLSDYQVIIAYGLPSATVRFDALKEARKPIWYIVTPNTDVTIGQQQTAATLNINPALPQDVFAAANPAFSAFTLPVHLPAVLDKMPPLSTASGAVQASPAAQTLLIQKNGASAPLWLLQTGAIPQSILFGEGLWRWRLYEYRYFKNHDVVDECIRQTVALLAANVQENPFRVVLSKFAWSNGENVKLNAYLLNASNEQVNAPEATIVITDSAGKKQPFTFERSGNAYQLNIGIQAGGTYTFQAKTSLNGKTYTTAGSFVVNEVSLEMMTTGADYPLLYELSKKYGGSTVPEEAMASLYDSISKNENIRPVIRAKEQTVPLIDWKWYFLLILLVAVAEWLLRKYWLAQ